MLQCTSVSMSVWTIIIWLCQIEKFNFHVEKCLGENTQVMLTCENLDAHLYYGTKDILFKYYGFFSVINSACSRIYPYY